MGNKASAEQQNKHIGVSSWKGLTDKFNELALNYMGVMPQDNFYSAFARAGLAWANAAPIQNSRIKAISSLPVDYTKELIGEMLRNPYHNEEGLRETSQILRWTAYPYFKVAKTYQDIPTYRYYTKSYIWAYI